MSDPRNRAIPRHPAKPIQPALWPPPVPPAGMGPPEASASKEAFPFR